MNKSLVSVILPVYNGERFLGEAIESILSQTYTKFEFLIIDDGSTDDSFKIAKKFSDPRIVLLKKKNEGLAKTLNDGIKQSRGRYIARMDQDDIAYSTRIEKQLAFLDAHPDYGMVGTWAEIQRNGVNRGKHKHPEKNIELQFELLFDNPFVHSSVMFPKAVIEKVGMYSTDPSRQPPEDYELWSRIARRYKVANIPEVLMTYREIDTSMSRTSWALYRERVIDRNIENMIDLLGTNDLLPIIKSFTHHFHQIDYSQYPLRAGVFIDLIDHLTAKVKLKYPDEYNAFTFSKKKEGIIRRLTEEYSLRNKIKRKLYSTIKSIK